MARVSRSQWLDHGLAELARAGPDALRADRLCKGLGVSRGSFYWHFRDLSDFRAAVLDAWREQSEKAAREAAASSDPLAHLMGTVGDTDDVERAIRAWSVQSEGVREVVEGLDRRREAILTQMLAQHPDAGALARLIYAAALGRTWLNAGPDDARVRALLLSLT